MSTDTYEPGLQAVKERFDHWRTTRLKRGKIPAELIAMVPPLIEKFPRNRIATALHLSYAELNRLKANTPEATKSMNIFAEYSLAPQLPVEHNCTLEFNRQNGITVKISGLTPAHLKSLVPILMDT